ncbi:hypothetical protein CONCODRAFT_7376 [Conidiobolus coronatus NRRL 28638]|uniref:Pre-mRNA-processing protein 45 n=1 Tax=Conidiobolus coronatus (strain ATCC 28846 / CBS 209.66 / NRRL 28638) TaxID=796925 RepID=A0A137P5C6_CONC2|nr:hypothetical protein CONCODRAFT_7376 [Conidiobolus coronatus NRRL 28638]|eukprot:KXN70134.1 hypothetical protein CONCODRAFT_7376 [Conidiobolus coronatus NRRL 28638]
MKEPSPELESDEGIVTQSTSKFGYKEKRFLRIKIKTLPEFWFNGDTNTPNDALDQDQLRFLIKLKRVLINNAAGGGSPKERLIDDLCIELFRCAEFEDGKVLTMTPSYLELSVDNESYAAEIDREGLDHHLGIAIAGSRPVPVLHSPPRKVTAQEQKDWIIPPCIKEQIAGGGSQPWQAAGAVEKDANGNIVYKIHNHDDYDYGSCYHFCSQNTSNVSHMGVKKRSGAQSIVLFRKESTNLRYRIQDLDSQIPINQEYSNNHHYNKIE